MTGGARSPGEFELIRRYFAPLATGYSGGLGLEDDAAVITLPQGRELVVTTDTMVEGVHYLAGELAGLIARKLLRVNLSDLAAMGARPEAYFLNAAWPKGCDEDWIAAFAGGLATDQRLFGMPLAGGDTVSTSGPATFTVTALGTVQAGRALRRSGAVAGDHVYVSGTIGDGTLGLDVALGTSLPGPSPKQLEELRQRFSLPDPRLRLGQMLASREGAEVAHAAADVSDGLVADLGHICSASGVGAVVHAEAVPVSEAGRAALAHEPALLTRLITGGDDYELVFTAPPEAAARIGAIAAEASVPLTRVGEIVAGRAVTVLDASGDPMGLTATGFRHR